MVRIAVEHTLRPGEEVNLDRVWNAALVATGSILIGLVPLGHQPGAGVGLRPS